MSARSCWSKLVSTVTANSFVAESPRPSIAARITWLLPWTVRKRTPLRVATRTVRFRSEAGEHRHGQQFRGGITAALNRRAHHLAAAVDGQKAHAAARCHAHGTLHRLADVVIFLVQEDIFSLPQQFAHEVHAGRRVKLHPDFIEADL